MSYECNLILFNWIYTLTFENEGISFVQLPSTTSWGQGKKPVYSAKTW
jgi:hypothetical protein